VTTAYVSKENTNKDSAQYWYFVKRHKPDKPVTESQVTAFRQESDAYFEAARNSDYAHIAVRVLQADHISSLTEIYYAWSKWSLVYDQPGKVEPKKVEADTHLAPKLKEGMDKTQQELLIVSP
jgi:hypothetical protein